MFDKEKKKIDASEAETLIDKPQSHPPEEGYKKGVSNFIDDMKELETKTSLLVRIGTFFRLNKDLAILILLAVSFTVFGYILACIKYGLTAEQIRLSLSLFVEFVVSLLAAVGATIWKIVTPPGVLTTSVYEKIEMRATRAKERQKRILAKRQEREKDIDPWGKSINSDLQK